jgi:hypothetical protein
MINICGGSRAIHAVNRVWAHHAHITGPQDPGPISRLSCAGRAAGLLSQPMESSTTTKGNGHKAIGLEFVPFTTWHRCRPIQRSLGPSLGPGGLDNGRRATHREGGRSVITMADRRLRVP